MILKNKIEKIISILKETGIEEIEISSFWGAQKIRVSNKSNNLQNVIISKSQDDLKLNNNIKDENTAPIKINEGSNLDLNDNDLNIDNTKTKEIIAPLVGTFYSAPKSDSPPFVKEGDNIQTGQTICIIEAMKIFNEIDSEISGKIVKILVENGTPVEYSQPLMIIEEK